MRFVASIAASLLLAGTGCALSEAIPVSEVPVEGPVPLRDRYARGRLVLLAEVNEDRAAEDAPPVMLDSLATAVAQRHAEAWFIGSPPHRATILDPSRTHVGIGIAEDERGAVYVVQEFLARRATIEGMTRRSGSTIVRGSVVRPGMRPLLVYLSPVEEASAGSTFVPPAGPYTDGVSGGTVVPPWAIEWDPATGSFSVSVEADGTDPTVRRYGIVYVAPEKIVERAIERGEVDSSSGMPGAAFFVDGS